MSTNYRRMSERIGGVRDSEMRMALESLATHRVPLSEAPDAYRMFREKSDGCIKVILQP